MGHVARAETAHLSRDMRRRPVAELQVCACSVLRLVIPTGSIGSVAFSNVS